MKFLKNLITVIAILAMIAVGGLFAVANDAPVPLDLLALQLAPQSLAVWVLAAFVLGGLLGMLVSSALMLRLRTSLSASRRRLDKTRTELAKLRDQNPGVEGA
ncbi:MAG: LapA family protein [Gammaproteobacteria bacterium]|jgi:uncharacterized integral membrane protein|nr:LapA family protein [Gammaproteobacteria bacterium]